MDQRWMAALCLLLAAQYIRDWVWKRAPEATWSSVWVYVFVELPLLAMVWWILVRALFHV